MADENAGPISLDVDLREVDTTMPVLPKGLYDLQIHKFTKEANKDKTGYNLKVELRTTSPITSVQGNEVAAGFPLFVYLPLQPSKKEGSTWDFRQKLAQLQEAAIGEKKASFDTDELIGKIVRASVKPEDSEDFGMSNKVGRFTAPE